MFWLKHVSLETTLKIHQTPAVGNLGFSIKSHNDRDCDNSKTALGGYYGSEKAVDADSVAYRKNCGDNHNNCNGRETFSSLLKRFGRFCMKMVRKGNTNSFEVLKGEESKASTPVTAFVLLLIFAPWITIPLVIIGLFFGFRYRFTGPDCCGNAVNDAMNSAADAAVNLKKSME